ncbi:MAG: ThiS family protein [Methanoregulaceae archaeon PtaB.Bin108]|nr:MAG: ThiS family protein [Methanoregulaceae archaeon PtaB.Bin108]
MKITVRMFGRFKQQFWDRKEVSVSEGATVMVALEEVISAFQEGRTTLFDDKGQVRNHIILMVNQKRISHAECGSVVLHDGDELAVLPPVAGG